jgi:hypothetical protein
MPGATTSMTFSDTVRPFGNYEVAKKHGSAVEGRAPSRADVSPPRASLGLRASAPSVESGLLPFDRPDRAVRPSERSAAIRQLRRLVDGLDSLLEVLQSNRQSALDFELARAQIARRWPLGRSTFRRLTRSLRMTCRSRRTRWRRQSRDRLEAASDEVRSHARRLAATAAD